MPIRNPFARRPGIAVIQDENVRPDSASGKHLDPVHPGFERVDTVGSKASSVLSIRSSKSQDTGAYKMSVVNDSGVYLPPSPTEKESSWPRRYLSRNSTDTRSVSDTGEIEHFSISRESFDSYRRSFDICAKSPVVATDTQPTRSSLDSARFLPRHPRAALHERRFEREPPTPEEGFEDVGLHDDTAAHVAAAATAAVSKPAPPPMRKRAFFKFGSEQQADAGAGATSGAAAAATTMTPATTMSRFLPGRKRGQSGQGAELAAMPERPRTAAAVAEAFVPEEQQQQVVGGSDVVVQS